jgi:hypothetical protein
MAFATGFDGGGAERKRAGGGATLADRSAGGVNLSDLRPDGDDTRRANANRRDVWSRGARHPAQWGGGVLQGGVGFARSGRGFAVETLTYKAARLVDITMPDRLSWI